MSDEQEIQPPQRTQRRQKVVTKQQDQQESSSSNSWGFSSMWNAVSDMSANLADKVLDALDDFDGTSRTESPSLAEELEEAKQDDPKQNTNHTFSQFRTAVTSIAPKPEDIQNVGEDIFNKGTDVLENIGQAAFHMFAKDILGRRTSVVNENPTQAQTETENVDVDDNDVDAVEIDPFAPTLTQEFSNHVAVLEKIESSVHAAMKDLENSEYQELVKDCESRVDVVFESKSDSIALEHSDDMTPDDDHRVHAWNTVLESMDEVSSGLAAQARIAHQELLTAFAMSAEVVDESNVTDEQMETQEAEELAQDLVNVMVNTFCLILGHSVELASKVVLEGELDVDDVDDAEEILEYCAVSLSGVQQELVLLRHDAIVIIREALGSEHGFMSRVEREGAVADATISHLMKLCKRFGQARMYQITRENGED